MPGLLTKTIPYSRQYITPEDEAAVLEVLRSDYITRGPVTRQLEDALCELTGKKHVYVVSNGTVALWAALRVMAGTKIYTPTLTFAAIGNAAKLNFMDVFLSDVDDDTLCAEFEPSVYVEDELVMCPLDYAGYPSLRKALGIPTLLDACHAVGATLPDGSSNTKYADVAVCSGHAVKAITGAELGWIATDSDYYANGIKTFRDIGRIEGKHYTPALNLHTSEMNSALYLSQLKRLPENLARRRTIAAQYYQAFGNDFRLILPVDDPGHAWHLFVVRLSEHLNCSRDDFRKDLLELGVGSQVHYLPMHRQPLFHSDVSFPVAEHAYERMLSIPMYYGLTDEQQDHVIESINRVLDKYSK